MKKSGIITLVILYTIAMVGINLSVHYCGERLDSVTIGAKQDKCCCGTEKDDSCCTTKYIKTKVNDTHTPGTKQKITPPIAVPINTDSALTPVIPSSKVYQNEIEQANPPPPGIALYLRNRNILI
ncbi:MAG: hypothetical protein M0D57_09175 [Sphingobacteriales bacterium JAD_PAG50586_3]|nr:MAG: hypothetical protein M0D57_09175 [Sphingobacteriales bacterium JAD_PAG50586_3]